VSIANLYGVNGLGIQSRERQDFLQTSTLRPTQLPVQLVPGLFPGGKATATWR
jgi:hypothetical protein